MTYIPIPIRNNGVDLNNAADINQLQENIAAMGPARNALINPGMDIDQRNSGASKTITAGAAMAYTVDRWWSACTGANVTAQRTDVTAWPEPIPYSMMFTGLASNTGVKFGQRIERINSYRLANQALCLSAYMKASVAKIVTWAAYYANTDDSFGTLASPTKTQIASGTWNITTTATQFYANFTGPIETNSHGIEIIFSVPTLLGSETWIITGAKLEVSSTPSLFYREANELEKCLRYAYQGNLNIWGFAGGGTNPGIYCAGSFPARMRVAPSIAYVTGGEMTFYGFNLFISGITSSPDFVTPTGFGTFRLQTSGPGTANYSGFPGNYQAVWLVEAEL